MADIMLAREGGFVFNNFIVNNNSDIYLLSVEKPLVPTLQRFDLIAPCRNGSKSFDNRYEDRFVTVNIAVYDNSIVNRKSKIRDILNKVIGLSSRLSFLDEPELFYNAKVYDTVLSSENDLFTVLTIVFKCSFCMFKFSDDLNDIIVDNMKMTVDDLDILVNSFEYLNISSSTDININNAGNYKSNLNFIITANSNCSSIVVSNGTNSFTLTDILSNETIYVDGETMIVYKYVNNAKVSVLNRFTGKFLDLGVGDNVINISGSSFNCNIEVNYRDTFLY